MRNAITGPEPVFSEDEEWFTGEVFRLMQPEAFIKACKEGRVVDHGGYRLGPDGYRIRIDLGEEGACPLAMTWVFSLPPSERPPLP